MMGVSQGERQSKPPRSPQDAAPSPQPQRFPLSLSLAVWPGRVAARVGPHVPPKALGINKGTSVPVVNNALIWVTGALPARRVKGLDSGPGSAHNAPTRPASASRSLNSKGACRRKGPAPVPADPSASQVTAWGERDGQTALSGTEGAATCRQPGARTPQTLRREGASTRRALGLRELHLGARVPAAPRSRLARQEPASAKHESEARLAIFPGKGGSHRAGICSPPASALLAPLRSSCICTDSCWSRTVQS